MSGAVQLPDHSRLLIGSCGGCVCRFYGLLNTLNYVLILAGPILVALSAFTTYASMVCAGPNCFFSAEVGAALIITSEARPDLP